MMQASAKVIAFYLPQFHPIPENDKWWGSGFTEWHNVARARPLFRGHLQPRLPGELGFYDLRLSESRIAQAELARQHGVYGFCYWHYWFSGKRLLSRPLDEVLRTKEPNFPFCVGWANESWTGAWHGASSRILIEQRYPPEDADAHFDVLSRYFEDDRYIRVDGKPLLYIYRPKALAQHSQYLARFRELADKRGLPNLYIVGTWSPNPNGRFNSFKEVAIDAVAIINITGRDSHAAGQWLFSALEKTRMKFGVAGPRRLTYEQCVHAMLPNLKSFPFPAYHTVLSNWDNTPRSGRRGLVLTGSTPERFGRALRMAVQAAEETHSESHRLIFLKSWNEWAEGNYVEPDQAYGRKYLEAIKLAVAPNRKGH